MAADQRRKRMNSPNVIGFSSREHHRDKRKKIGSSQDGALRSGDHISLEWDRNRSKVVSKKEQVGLSVRHLRQFVDYVPPKGNILAQVCPVPPETFQLENLSEVLSNEVWQACLSDGERDYLRQFLPEGVDAEQVVQALLDGENFHFGNPFLDWGSAVCSNKAHPDKIVSKELRLRADKRRYYSDLEKYHNDMIDYLQMLKEKWESSKDPEKDVVTKMWWRSRRGSAQVNGSCQDVTTASESGSWNSDDKPCSNDNKISAPVPTRELQRRPKISAVKKENSQSPLIAVDNVVNVGGKGRKRDNIPKHSIQQTDGAKYMSYLKISKKQHQIVTSMKQSGKSIQSKALNRILGSNLNVRPYGVFVEEEQKKLNAHWLQLVKDLPAAYAIWKKMQLQKRDIIKSLERELKEKLDPQMEDKQLYPTETLLQKNDVQLHLRNSDQESGDLAPEVEDPGIFSQASGKNHSPSEDPSSYGDQITYSGQVDTYPSQVSSPGNNISLADTEEKQYSPPYSPTRRHSPEQMDVEANDYSCSMQGPSLPQALFPSEPHASGLHDAKHSLPELENALPDERIPCSASNHGEESQYCSGGDVWQPVGGIRESYIGRQAYTPSGGLSVIHHPEGDEGGKNCFIDLRSNMTDEVDRRKMLQQKANTSFGSFPNNDQNELLQSMFKGQQGVAPRTTEQLHSLLKVSEEHKQMMGIGFQQEGSSNILMQGNQFSGQFQDQMPMSQGQQRHVDAYGQGSLTGNIYCDRRGFLMERPNWNNDCAQMGVITTQPQLSTAPLLNQNWQFKSMWTNTNGVGIQTGTERDQSLLRVAATNAEQSIHRGSTSDQSLFSVLSQCSQLRHPGTVFEPESSRDQAVASSNYRMMMEGGATQQPVNPLNYLSGSNPPTSLMPDDVAWMNQSRQNSGLHDPLGKLYPRSWNP